MEFAPQSWYFFHTENSSDHNAFNKSCINKLNKFDVVTCGK